MRSIKNQLPSLVQDLTHQHAEWISTYQLYRFNDSSTLLKSLLVTF